MNAAIITGGNRGIGLAITKKLKQLGYYTIVVHKDPDRKIVSNLADLEIVTDLSELKNISPIYDQMLEDLSADNLTLDLLVNNAGVASAKKFVDLTVDDFSSMMSVNLGAVFQMSRFFVEHCKKGSNKDIQSRIINISSVSGLQGFSGMAHYCASKFALNGMSQVMAKELSKLGIAVNTISPGPTKSSMWDQLDKEYKANGFMPEEANEDDYTKKLLIRRMGEPEDVAEAVEYLVKSSYTTGANILVCGGNILR